MSIPLGSVYEMELKMKRLLTAALALTLLGGTAASAQSYNHDNRNDGHRDGYSQRRDNDRHDSRDRHDNRRHWSKGQRLDRSYRADRYYVADYRRHGLRTPPRGYRWQRVDDNYILASVASGLISSVILANR
jgi:Ni/Co efflux regulator RcnB